MKLYELNYLMPSDIKAEEIQQKASSVELLIQEQGGILTQERKKEAIKLSYPVKDKTEVFIFTIRFQIEEDQVASLNEKIKNMPGIFRIMIETVKKRKARTKIRAKKRDLKPSAPTKKEGKAKVELKKIEEKLDQILDES